jgi:hypothetical protein
MPSKEVNGDRHNTSQCDLFYCLGGFCHGLFLSPAARNQKLPWWVVTPTPPFKSGRTAFTVLYLGWGVLPLIMASKIVQSPRDFGALGVALGLYTAAYWVCGLAMTTGARWTWCPSMGLIFLAWAVVSAQSMRILVMLFGQQGGELSQAARQHLWINLGYQVLLFLLPLSILLLLGWRLRPARRRPWNARHSPHIGRLR